VILNLLGHARGWLELPSSHKSQLEPELFSGCRTRTSVPHAEGPPLDSIFSHHFPQPDDLRGNPPCNGDEGDSILIDVIAAGNGAQALDVSGRAFLISSGSNVHSINSNPRASASSR